MTGQLILRFGSNSVTVGSGVKTAALSGASNQSRKFGLSVDGLAASNSYNLTLSGATFS